MIADCTAVILAGGKSQRMGRDKASLVLGEQTLLQHVAGILQTMFPRVLVSVRQPRPDIALPQICDAYADAGPLAGLYTALTHAETPWIFAVATDMPFIQLELIDYLTKQRDGYQAVVPVMHGHPQPLAAFYAMSCLDPIRVLLEGEGKRSLRAALAQLKVCYIAEADLLAVDPGLRSFFDLDTPEDVAAARMSNDLARKP